MAGSNDHRASDRVAEGISAQLQSSIRSRKNQRALGSRRNGAFRSHKKELILGTLQMKRSGSKQMLKEVGLPLKGGFGREEDFE
jgi:hypothetical protein